MKDWYVSMIRPDMDVFDSDGVKIGTVAHVHNHPALVTAGEAGDRPPSGDVVIEVRTGLLGLGTHYFIPSSAIADVTDGGDAFLTVARDALHSSGWQTKPADVDERR